MKFKSNAQRKAVMANMNNKSYKPVNRKPLKTSDNDLFRRIEKSASPEEKLKFYNKKIDDLENAKNNARTIREEKAYQIELNQTANKRLELWNNHPYLVP